MPELSAQAMKNKLTYRATYRGTKEMDVLLKKHIIDDIADMSSEELAMLSDILDTDDDILHKVLTKKIAPPQQCDNIILERLINKINA